MADRAMTPVVSKTLTVSIVVLYIAGMTTILLGGVVPEYRSNAGAELGDRVLATAGESIESTVPEANGTVEANRTVDLPPRIRGQQYELELANSSLHLRHPDERIGDTVSLALPPGTTVDNTTWRSGSNLEIRVRGPATNRTLSIQR